jgi:hypothetical protein
MFKKASDNTQSRIARSVDFNRQNGGGVDPNAFRPSGQAVDFRVQWELTRQRLFDEKSRVQEQIRENNLARRNAEMASHINRTAISHQMMNKLGKQRDELSDELHLIEQQIRQHKDEKRLFEIRHSSKRTDNRMTLEGAFYEMAQRIIAKPVYQRVLTAAVHHLKDAKRRSASMAARYALLGSRWLWATALRCTFSKHGATCLRCGARMHAA